MFTGLIEEIGKIQAIEAKGSGIRFLITAEIIIEDLKIGDSVAVNGCCLTVVELQKGAFAIEAVQESISRTNLGDLSIGNEVNLERAMRFDTRLGGHLVQGHVDGVGTVKSRKALDDGSWLVHISAGTPLLRYLVEKGSVTVDGVSLTVVNVNEDSFSFAMIPHTTKVTALGAKMIGSKVNIEIDLIAKYVEKLMRTQSL